MSRGEGGREQRLIEGLADFPFELKSLQERPKRRPRGPKRRQEAAKRRQDSAEERQVSAKRCQDAPKSDLAAIWARFGTLRGGPKPSKTIEKTRVFKVFVFFQRRRKKSPKELPKGAQEGQTSHQKSIKKAIHSPAFAGATPESPHLNGNQR